jgi:hypothetical protein
MNAPYKRVEKNMAYLRYHAEAPNLVGLADVARWAQRH